MRDCIVVGAGIAGLTAAWKLRERDVLVLEAEERVGGRIKSELRDGYPVSVGAHMFPGPGSILAGLVADLGLETLRIQGSLLGLAYRGTILSGGRVEAYPLRLPMSLAGRVSFARAGLRLRRDAGRYNDLARPRPGDTPASIRDRLLSFHDHWSFAEYLGPLHPEAEAIFRATARRLTAEPDQISAGCMIALFAHVWSEGGVVLGYNLRGGPSALPTELARRLGERVLLAAPVSEIALEDAAVRVRYRKDRREVEERARTAIVTTPAPITRALVRDLPPETERALAKVTYGPFVVAGILTGERGPMPWDGLYSLLTVDTCFNMLFNHANALRQPGGPREPGGALMVYGGADLARRLWDLSDGEIADRVSEDLRRLYPEAEGIVHEVLVQRWEHAIPYATPGRHAVQTALERGVGGRIFLAGDYVGEWTHMEAAAQTALEAAAKVARVLSPSAPEG
jgi:oxygen-dependent protoporphyrinogen oxidase